MPKKSTKPPDKPLLSGGQRNKGQFKPGKSGNPGGRPSQPDAVKEMLKAATIPAVQLLINTMNNDAIKHELRIRCAELLLDRALGKAQQVVEASVTTQAFDWSGITTNELRRLAAIEEHDSKTANSEGSED